MLEVADSFNYLVIEPSEASKSVTDDASPGAPAEEDVPSYRPSIHSTEASSTDRRIAAALVFTCIKNMRDSETIDSSDAILLKNTVLSDVSFSTTMLNVYRREDNNITLIKALLREALNTMREAM